MPLTTTQIQQLYTFSQKHYVEWYDVQTELVDHLANGIEAQWKNNPHLPFEEALQMEFKKFGVTGFSEVIDQKTSALNKRYHGLLWHYFEGYLSLPKVLLTAVLIWAYFELLVLVPQKLWIIIPTAVLFIVIPIWKIYSVSKRIKLANKHSNKKWLFDNVASHLGGFLSFLQIPFQIIFQIGLSEGNEYWSAILYLLFSVIVVLFALAIYIAIFVVSPQLRKDMAKQHPEYKLV